jgi:hypothetical protein
MNPTTVDIKDLLVTNSSLGLVFATNLFIGRQPAMPDTCVTLYDTSAMAPEYTLSAEDSGLYEYPAVQVKVRANNYLDGYDLASSIYFDVHNSDPQTINGTLYSSILAAQTPTLMRWDENDRAEFIFNLEIKRR